MNPDSTCINAPFTWQRLLITAAVMGLLSACHGGSSVSSITPPGSDVAAGTARAFCGPGSRPESGIQGRVPLSDHESGRAAEGYTCNTELVGEYTIPDAIGTVGGFKTERYVDASGRECAYYDTTLVFGANLADGQAGVNVLDMSDPSQPSLSARLVTAAMQSPHESLILNQERGLLVAVLGNPASFPGAIDIYDVSADCRSPVLVSSSGTGVLGHESGMPPDGLTYYTASLDSGTLAAVDISNPVVPIPLWFTNDYQPHGLSLSDDGDRAYVTVRGGMVILDTSEVQARVPNPTVTEIVSFSWSPMSTPQNALPVTIDGAPYLVEFDEFGAQTEVGAGRIIDIRDETNPFVVSEIRLEVHNPENFDAQVDDPGATALFQGYANHYCSVPKRVNPGIVACSMIVSGLRVFDIRDPFNPREIAYFNAPVNPRVVTEPSPASNYAMASPAFVPERGEIWYNDGHNGFYAVRVTNGVWPFTD